MTQEGGNFLKQEAMAYLEKVGATPLECQDVIEWVEDGNSVYDNPWHIAGENGAPKDYIAAQRDAEMLAEQYASTEAPLF